mgnify:FL=1
MMKAKVSYVLVNIGADRTLSHLPLDLYFLTLDLYILTLDLYFLTCFELLYHRTGAMLSCVLKILADPFGQGNIISVSIFY